MERTIIPLVRATEARMVPTGEPLSLPAGAFVTVTQALGGAYTVVYGGNMARIDGEDADALGFEPETLELAPPEDGLVSNDQVWQALRTVHDPEIPVNIVDLGLVYACDVRGSAVDIDLTLTAPAAAWPRARAGCGEAGGKVPFVTAVNVNLVFDPPWDRAKMTEEAQLELGLY